MAAPVEKLRARIWPVVSDVAIRIEHVGSTSVPGLAAKPIIDLTVVVGGRTDVPLTITRLATLGYRHRGNLGIEDREAFDHRPELPRHNLYVCPEGTIGVVNQLAVRDYLRAQPDAARHYGNLKRRLAVEFPTDIDSSDFSSVLLRPCDACSSARCFVFWRYQYSLKPRVHSLSHAKPRVRVLPRTPPWCLTGQIA